MVWDLYYWNIWQSSLQRIQQSHLRCNTGSPLQLSSLYSYHVIGKFPQACLNKCLRSRALWLSSLVLCRPSWSVGDWGVCSRSCGGGEQIRQVQCIQRTSRNKTAALADSECAQPSPARRQACNAHSCPPVWTTGPWSQVSMCESDQPNIPLTYDRHTAVVAQNVYPQDD